MSTMYHKTPSELLRIEEDYTAFCLDEACIFIRLKMEDAENPQKPNFKEKATSFSDFYEQLDKKIK